MQIIYSGVALRGVKLRAGDKALNPTFFTAPENGAKAVFLNGDYPAIAKAYKQAGVPVRSINDYAGDGAKAGKD